MVSQEIQTISGLLVKHTGLIGRFPSDRPLEIHFMLEDGAPIHLVGFEVCHPSMIAKPGQKKVACFAKNGMEKRVSPEDWRNLTESANAVLFTKKGRQFEVEILKRAASPTAESNGWTMTVYFVKTGMTDQFIPCGG